jgi:hypothetical protein
MSNGKIHPEHGYIIGGAVEKRLKGRLTRDVGAKMYMDWLIENKAIERKPYYIKLLFIPKEKPRQWWLEGDINIEFGIYALRDFCYNIKSHKMLNKWLPIRTWNARNEKWLDYYGTQGHDMAGWEKNALKDKALVKELKQTP